MKPNRGDPGKIVRGFPFLRSIGKKKHPENLFYWVLYNPHLFPSLLAICVGIFFVYFQSSSIYGGDAGDLVSAAIVSGVAHPPGYPLYISLGNLIIKYLPYQTPAWRMALLSSIPSALVLLFLYLLFYTLAKKRWIAVFSALSFIFLYPVWLYSQVVEVFSLNSLFFVLLLLTSVRFFQTGSKKYLFLFAYIMGMGLAHHHLILFLIPATVIGVITFRKISLIHQNFLPLFLLSTVVGLVPYLYVLISASNNPDINWLGNPTIGNLFALITRSGYGTFVTGNFIGHEPLARVMEIVSAFIFVWNDFRPFGVLLILFGIWKLYQNNKKMWIYFISLILSYLFFLFYASFPLTDNFMVATFERFLIPLYLLLSPFLFFGMASFASFIFNFTRKLLSPNLAAVSFRMACILMFLYPVNLLIANYPKITVLKNDRTADFLGRDILTSAGTEGILILSSDTSLFNTQYYYYANDYPKGLVPVHYTKLFNFQYRQTLKRNYPKIRFPSENTNQAEFIDGFLEINSPDYPVFSKFALSFTKGKWIPWGLVFRYYPPGISPDKDEVAQKNSRIWNTFADPLSGSLSKYKNLMLTDVVNVYSVAHQETGYWLAVNGFDTLSIGHFRKSIQLSSNDTDSYSFLSQVYIDTGKCDDAKKVIAELDLLSGSKKLSYFLNYKNYSVCLKDKKNASVYWDLYEKQKSLDEKPLKEL